MNNKKGRRQGVSLLSAREQRKNAYDMYYTDKLSQKEIAEKIGYSVSSISNMIKREEFDRKRTTLFYNN